MSFNLINTNIVSINKNNCFEILIRNIILADKYLKRKQKNQYKIVRCSKCLQCLQRYNCLKCINCLNKPSLGGDGKRKQGCIYRKCLNPTKLYNY